MRFIDHHMTRFRPVASTHFEMRDNNMNVLTQARLAGFCQKVEKTGLFHGKNRTGKNRFMPELSSK